MMFRLFIVSTLSFLAFSHAAWAIDNNVNSSNTGATCEELQQEIARLNNTNKVLDTVIKNLIRRIEVLERATLDEPAKENQQTHAEKKSLEKAVDPEVQARLQQEIEENYQLIENAFGQRLGKEEGMLLKPYEFVYEPSISYAHTSYDKIVVDGFSIFPVLVVGDIVSELVKRDIVTNNHSFRVGLPWDTQFDLVVPLGYERERTYRADGTYDSEETEGLGDISLALSHQLTKSHQFWPDTLIGVSWKSTTGEDPYRLVTADEPALGSGFETWGASMTFMSTVDPVVLFGGLSGTYTPGEDKKIGHVKPGESYGLNLGIAIALNLETSLSFNYQYSYTMETEIEGQEIKGSYLTTSTLAFGLSKAQSDRFAIDVDLGVGLTSDSPDFQLTVSFPFNFLLKDTN